jgi:hypothetical protein
MDSLLWGMAAGAVADGRSQATPSGARGEATESRVRDLERRLEKLALVCQALWSLVRDRQGVTDDDLARRVRELDLTDGRLDGRLAPAITCGTCGRVTARRREKCLYCGAPREGASAFETL